MELLLFSVTEPPLTDVRVVEPGGVVLIIEPLPLSPELLELLPEYDESIYDDEE